MLTELIINIVALTIAITILLAPAVITILIVRAIILKANKNKNPEPPVSTKQYSTGYRWNEQTQLWEPPGYKPKPVQNKPSYEEWKATNQPYSKPEDNSTINNSTYNFKSSEIPKDEVKITPKQPKQEPINKTPEQKPINKQSEQERSKTTQSEFQGAYKAASILTENESLNYKVLKEAADRKGYTISVKMRLADLITPTASRYDKSYMSYFGRIKAKHVDFVVFDQYMRPKAIIELDDRSHDRKDRQERDKFVDEILKDAGYKVIHTRYIWPDILDNV